MVGEFCKRRENFRCLMLLSPLGGNLVFVGLMVAEIEYILGFCVLVLQNFNLLLHVIFLLGGFVGNEAR